MFCLRPHSLAPSLAHARPLILTHTHTRSPALALPRPPSHPMATRPPRGTPPPHQAKSQPFDGRLLLAICRLQPCFIPICLLYSLIGALQSADCRSDTTPLSLTTAAITRHFSATPIRGHALRGRGSYSGIGDPAVCRADGCGAGGVTTMSCGQGNQTSSQVTYPFTSPILFRNRRTQKPPESYPDSAGAPCPKSNTKPKQRQAKIE